MRLTAPALLAEVSDKGMSFPSLLLWNAAIIVATWWLVGRSRWLVLIPLAVAAILALATVDELRDPHVGPALIHELGYSYFVLSFLPLAAVVSLFLIRRRVHEARPNA